MVIYIVMHYQPSNFWKPSDFGIQQSIFTVKITAMYSAHEPACEAIKNIQIDLKSVKQYGTYVLIHYNKILSTKISCSLFSLNLTSKIRLELC